MKIMKLRQNAVKKPRQNAVKNEILPELLSIKTQYGLQAKRNGGLEQNAVILKQNAIFVASYGTVLASCQHSTLCVRKYCVSELSSCAGSELGSELTLLAGSELKTSELDTSELKTSEYRFLKIFILASYEQELCQFNFLLASCQLSSSELHIASYRLIEDNFLASCEQELCPFNFLPASCQVSSSELQGSELWIFGHLD
ncbi:hypothetical protein Tco_0976682 [Tanacetum coccineum]|uniref:Uncharacterized protein n=1 Tax=Tanacetum coccineum TaxID=301880 RepID=A0ABQ5EHZ8_9ASTR